MSDQTLRAAIKARLLALGAGIGRVHDYERWSNNAATYLQLFQDAATKKIFGWEIVRTGYRTQKVAMRKWKVIHKYTLRGYYGLEDSAATEKAFNALVDLIGLDFTRTRLPGTQGDLNPEVVIETRVFGHVLCHVAEIRLPEVAEIVEELPEAGETDLLTIGLEYYLKPGDDLLDAQDLVAVGDEEGEA
jgi:hypothetical protein